MNVQGLAIIGIHGLLNKPPPDVLEAWWRTALEEGLRENHGRSMQLPFSLAYWADVRNANPIAVNDLEEPYQPAQPGTLKRYDRKALDKARELIQDKFGGAFDKAKDLVDIGAHTEKLLAVSLGDLADYYGDESIRRQMRARLRTLIEQHVDKRLLLITHSMGSIIGYDLMREFDAAPVENVSHFVTIGSPLGLPYVTKRIRDEFGALKTPKSVAKWTNLADPGDKVALDCNLDDEYSASVNGVSVEDVLVNNDYISPAGKRNNHKSYGYLRAPELSDIVLEFLDGQ